MSINRGRGFDEAELVKLAKQGDAAAFDQLIAAQTPQLYRIVLRMAPDASEAEAILQETWLRVWKALPRYLSDRPMRPWLTTIAMNVARDRWRKKEPLNFVDINGEETGFPDPGPSPEERMTRAEALAKLSQGVAALRPAYRTVIALRYDAELSYQEIADILGIPVNTVRTHLRRAKSILRDWMEAESE